MLSHFHFIVPVWGEDHTALFRDICLPLLLTKNNLQCFKDDPSALFVIVTRIKDAQLLRESENFARLEQIIPVRFIFADGLIDYRDPHKSMSRCYQLAMNLPQVVRGRTAFIFLTPDTIWSDGTMRRLYELRESGIRVVMVAGLRIALEKVQRLFRRFIRDNPTNPQISNATLVQIALESLHPMSLAHNLFGDDGEFLSAWPSHVYWIFGKEALICHAFHLHPILVVAPYRNVQIRTTIDGDFIARLGYRKHDFHVVCNCDEIVCFELSSITKSWGQPLSQPSLNAIQKFALRNANPIHWEFFKKRIIFKVDPAFRIPKEVEEHIDYVVHKICKWRLLSKIYYILYQRTLLLRIAQPVFHKIVRPSLRFFKNIAGSAN